MSDSEIILERVSQIVGQMCPLGRRTVAATDRITDDLGYDSIAIVELALVLEAEFDLQPIDEQDAVDLVTVGHVAELVGRMASVNEAVG
jgi:acyl carrier protein